MNKEQKSAKAQEIAIVNEVKNIANDVIVNKKPSTAVETPFVNELQATKKQVVNNVTAKTKTLGFRVNLLRDECETEAGKAFLNAANLTKDDVTVPNVLKCFTSMLVNEKPFFVKIVKLTEKNQLTFETLEAVMGAKIETVTFKFSCLDKNFLSSTANGEVLIIKNNVKYTLQIVETLNFNQVLSKIASYKRQSQVDAAKKIVDDAKIAKELLNVKTPEQKEAEIIKLKEKLAKLEK